jgi:folate-binding protein YgfZ
MQLKPSPFEYFRITGADRLEWLQGQVTQDLRPILPGEWKRTALLTATGQLSADGGVWMFEDQIILGLDRHAAVSVADTLKARIIMEDVELHPMPPATTIIESSTPSGLAIPVEHAGVLGFETFESVEGADQLAPADYNILRVEAAVPIAGIDYDTRTLAMEMGDYFIGSRIAFGKGCYTGQEVVERIRARGRTNKQWVGLSSKKPIEEGDGIRITSYAISPRFGHIALAFVPTASSEPGTRLGNAVVRSLPFS